ncbi:metallophosphoesterase [Corallococcus llansteffanensis]|uniref:Metallophosphoesterase n=1 Tax=Corallococcus llansteffanensis TaxID=2316731 RepID=A0A3A8PL66_9BACT|nr:metallophosphoesterase [Corallococcus llansteffanensis]RKH57123.1 metallophosphoesterase [Corallococcus llansteffanensis]
MPFPHFQGRFRLIATALVTVVQLPPVLWLCVRTRTPLPALVALCLSWPYLRQLESPWQTTPRARSTTLALGWWCACLVFDLLMLPAVLAIRAGTPDGATWGLAGAVALVLGSDAVLGWPRLRRRTVRIAGLAPGLDGYRIGQLSDVHCGPQVPEARVAAWVERLNGLDLDLVTVTGDLITRGPSHVEAVARALGGLRAKDGAFVCMGNHDYFTDGEHLVRELERHGLAVLRNRGVVVERDGARLYVAGVDDTWTSRHDLTRALAGRPEGTPTVLLAHDPDLFPQAQAQGVELTLSGHTHGGQLGVPGVRRLSLARFITRWTAGLYRQGRSWLYVNRGAGTTGPPVRLGAPAELAVITLRRA